MQDEALYKAQLRWSVLQLRLLHRLALEALLGVVERYLYATEVTPEYLGPNTMLPMPPATVRMPPNQC